MSARVIVTAVAVAGLLAGSACTERSESSVFAPAGGSVPSTVASSSVNQTATSTPSAKAGEAPPVMPAVAAKPVPPAAKVEKSAAAATSKKSEGVEVKATPAADTKTTDLTRLKALAATILDPKKFEDERVRESYTRAHDVADRLDKMYCYCHCKENQQLKHKSLLTCFQDDHAANCGICMNEANQAWIDWKDGLPLEVTLSAVDVMYNDGNRAPSMPHH